MSIPVSIDPLGTLGASREFVQPVMTSDTTWREDLPHTCGLVLSAKASGGCENLYKALDGDESSRCALSWGSDRQYSVLFKDTLVNVERVDALLESGGNGTSPLTLEGSADGTNFFPLTEKTSPNLKTKKWVAFEVPNVRPLKAIRLAYSHDDITWSGYQWIYDLKIQGNI